MKKFMDKDFELYNDTAVKLYEKYAKEMPIFDFHCHLSPKDIYEDRQFKNLTEVWLVDGHFGDHYKWRLMRGFGISEDYITGKKDDFEKFKKWAEVLPYTIGNPIYHWAHMELKKYFNIDKCLSPATAKEIYDNANEQLKTLTTRKLIEMNNVNIICTTDDPTDSLEYHLKLIDDVKNNKTNFKTKMLPAFRPDNGINIEKDTFNDWVKKLSIASNIEIKDLDTYEKAITNRMDFFKSVGCILSDHALDEVLYKDTTKEEVNDILIKKLNNKSLSKDEIAAFKGYIVLFLGKEYKKRNWVQQYHISALRNNSSKMMKILGPDTGFDSINDTNFIQNLAIIMNKLDEENNLPKTILYSLNTKDYETLATLANCFNEENIKSKVQLGAAWWFNDQLEGMTKQIKTLANMGLIANFVGMLTDSRSLLSYPRHDYFRRLLCNYFGELIEKGEYPNDLELVGQIVKNICYNNAINYFLGDK